MSEKTETAVELLPCPFCGMKGETDYHTCSCEDCCVCEGGHEHAESHFEEKLWLAGCSNSKCSIFVGMFESESEAIEAWNARADHPRIADLEKQIRELEVENEDLKLQLRQTEAESEMYCMMAHDVSETE